MQRRGLVTTRFLVSYAIGMTRFSILEGDRSGQSSSNSSSAWITERVLQSVVVTLRVNIIAAGKASLRGSRLKGFPVS